MHLASMVSVFLEFFKPDYDFSFTFSHNEMMFLNVIGITTGISAAERAKTMTLLGDPKSKVDDFVRPGHVFPLRAKDNGVLTRDGHTEAAVDLARLAGRNPSGVLCEIVSEEHPTEMARLPELKRFCKKHGFVLTSIVDIAQYRRDTEEHP